MSDVVDVSIYVQKGDNMEDGKYGFIFDEEFLNCYFREHDQRGELDAQDNLDRQLEGLRELLSYAHRHDISNIRVRTRSGIIRDAINHSNNSCNFFKLHRVYHDTEEILDQIWELCDDIAPIDVWFISGHDCLLTEAEDFANALIIYTDGSCLGNGRADARAGAAIYCGPGHRYNAQFKVYGEQTNNRAEYIAHAISNGHRYVIIRTDCDLIIKTMYEWIHAWKRRNWMTLSGTRVKNIDLILKIEGLMDQINVKFEKKMNGKQPKTWEAYTDGSAINNGRDNAQGGWGVYFSDGDARNSSGHYHGPQTNNRMEFAAVDNLLSQAKANNVDRLKIHTDSDLLKKTVEQYVPKWEKNGYRTANGGDVKNQDLIKSINSKLQDFESVEFQHVRGHSGIHGNERADQLARQAAQQYRPNNRY